MHTKKMNILSDIVSAKKRELMAKKKQKSPAQMAREAAGTNLKPRGFLKSIRRSERALPVIAELKRRSPSKGILREDFNVTQIAESYERAGASAFSILTDEPYFDGRLEYITRVRASSRLPILRKDFILDEYQLHESLLTGADAILLIVRILDDTALTQLNNEAVQMGLDTLIEVHDKHDLERALAVQIDPSASLLGINNRDLETFAVNLDTTKQLKPLIPGTITVVSESGIQTRADMNQLKACGIHAVLVGESLMNAKDPGLALGRLLNEESSHD